MESRISLIPNWDIMFRLAEDQATNNLTAEEGRELVLMMLAYGRRLHNKYQPDEKPSSSKGEING